MGTKFKPYLFVGMLMCCHLLLASQVLPQNNQASLHSRSAEAPVLDDAVMCEEIKDFTPKNRGVVFSIKIGKVSCFTSFDPVPKETFIYHKWFHKDKLSTQKRLTLQPPRWGTYSSIQLRETDKGPWRVEITDQEERILQTVRFTITD